MNNCVLQYVFLIGFLYHRAWHFLMGGGQGETMQFNKIEAFSQPKL